MRPISVHKIPKFKDVVDFTKWYLDNDMPYLPPEKQEVFSTDDASSVCVFRHRRFQLEIYLIKPEPLIPMHEHPGVNSIEIPANRWNTLTIEDLMNARLGPGMSHGLGIKERAKNSGFLLYSSQHWVDEKLPMNTIGAVWKGHTVGPLHENLIRRFYPDALVYPGYADITQKKVNIEIL